MLGVGTFVDKRRARDFSVAGVATPANYASVAAMKARLTAINGTYYSATNLNKYTHNDLVYALRLADDSAGI